MPTPIEREQVQRLLTDGAQLIEVLPRAEYEDEHLPGAINIPLKELDCVRVRQLERARPISGRADANTEPDEPSGHDLRRPAHRTAHPS